MIFNFIKKFKKIQIPFISPINLCFDLGTSNTRIAVENKGIVMREPSYLGYNSRIKEYIFFGKEAKSIIGKVPEYIKVNKPINHGVITDFDAAVSFVKKYFEDSVLIFYKNQLIKPIFNVIVAIPTIATEIEQKAVQELFLKVGINDVFLVEKSIVNALGCGFDVLSNQPNLIIDLGGGLIEMAIVSSGGNVAGKTLKTAGEYMNKLIYNYLYLKYGVILGETTCENLKINAMSFDNEEKTFAIRGKSLETGLPKSVKIKSSDIKEALLNNFNQIIDNIKELIESSPPEILDELLEKGLTLTGGLSRIKGIDEFFSNELKIDVFINNSYEETMIEGLFKLTKNPQIIPKLMIKI
mgnify:CR=1 FL=1